MFHTDRGSEFKNKLIDEALQTFDIQRSLSLKGTPYDCNDTHSQDTNFNKISYVLLCLKWVL